MVLCESRPYDVFEGTHGLRVLCDCCDAEPALWAHLRFSVGAVATLETRITIHNTAL